MIDKTGVVRVQHRPLSFEAMQWTGENTEEVALWVNATIEVVSYHHKAISPGPFLRVYKGERDIKQGEWIIRDGFDYRILSEEEFQFEFMAAAE